MTPKYEKLKEELREDFETLFPKADSALSGGAKSNSNHSAALVLWAGWEVLLREAIKETRNLALDEAMKAVPFLTPKEYNERTHDEKSGYNRCRMATLDAIGKLKK